MKIFDPNNTEKPQYGSEDWTNEKFPESGRTLRDYREASITTADLIKLRDFIEKEIFRRLGS